VTKLGVNIDHVATVRQARSAREPDPVAAAVLAELGGADGITVHLRQDRRHIQDRDVELLRKTVATHLNVEMSLDPGIVDVVLGVKPDQVTLVPERPEELTTEGGLDVIAAEGAIAKSIVAFKKALIRVSIFIDPDARQIEAAARAGADAVEIHTGRYAEAPPGPARGALREEIEKVSIFAHGRGLRVFAGHGLDYRNVKGISDISVIEELNIGFSIIARAVLVGLERAVREMKDIIT